MSHIRKALSAAFGAARRLAGETVTFRCELGELELVTLPGQTGFASDPEAGLVVRWNARDFLFRACELAFDGVRYEPKRGDVCILNGDVYEALSDNGAPPFRYMDNAHELLRLHTKRTDTED
jgi:hypothetical protein